MLAQDGRLVRVVAVPGGRRVCVVALQGLEEGRRGDGAQARGRRCGTVLHRRPDHMFVACHKPVFIRRRRRLRPLEDGAVVPGHKSHERGAAEAQV